MENKQIIQSTNYTTIRGSWGIYAQRLMVLLAEAMQYRYEDADLKHGTFNQVPMQLEWKFQISDFKLGETRNNDYIRRQLKQVLNACIEWIDENNTWRASVLFTDLKHGENAGEIVVKINDTLWNLFVEISKGFKKYQLETAMKFSSANALKLYQILSGNKEPVTYSIEYLRKLLGATKKYSLVKDFIKYTIEAGIKEINAIAEYSVYYEPIYKTIGRGRPIIDALRFHTAKKAENTENANAEIVRKYGLSTLPNALKVKLIESYEFTKQGIKANAELLQTAYSKMKEPTLMEFLDKRRSKAMQAKNPQGYIINAISKHLNSLS